MAVLFQHDIGETCHRKARTGKDSRFSYMWQGMQAQWWDDASSEDKE